MSEWISVKDRMPPRGDCLVITEDCEIYLCDYFPSVNQYWYLDEMIMAETITHWMPLPEPPKEDNDGNT